MRVAKFLFASLALLASTWVLVNSLINLFPIGKKDVYRVEPFLTLPWIKGKGAEGVGLVRVKDGSFYGPRSLAVDSKGGVLLLDSASRRILWFDREGNRKGSWFVPPGGRNTLLDHIAVDESDRVVVSDNACGILHIMEKGQWQRVKLGSGLCEGMRMGRFESLVAGNRYAYALFLALDRERLKRQVLRLDLHKRPPETEILSETEVTEKSGEGNGNGETKRSTLVNSLAVDPAGRVYLGGWERITADGKLRYVVSQLKRNNNEWVLRSVVSIDSPSFRTKLVAVDKKGHFYLVASPGYREGVLWKINARGEILWEGKGLWTGGIRATRYVAVSPGGEIYLMQPSAEGMIINRLTRTKK